MKKTRIAVFVSGGGTNLQALLDAQAAGRLPSGQIVLVVSSQPGAYALTRAEKAGVPTVVCSRKELGGQEAFETAILRALDEHGAEMIVLAGFMSILSKSFTDRFPERILNVHEAALERGVKVTGATVHFVNEIPDGGRIIAQKAVPVEDGDTPESLQRRVMEQAEWIILPQAAEMVAADIAERKEHGD